ncbi:MAG: hypothetical protein WD690_11620 [Vicinamibacterales bacterium]
MIILATLFFATAQAAQAVEATAIRVATPVRVAEIDTGKLKGEPVRLAWSADGIQLYLQTADRKSDGTAVARHYVIASSGGKFSAVDVEPPWAAEYWAWKSAQAAPGSPAFKIAVDSERRMLRSTATPRGSEIAGMGGDPGSGMAIGGSRAGGGAPVTVGEAQMAIVYFMLLNGDVIGEWVNAPIVPGETFSWSPGALGLIAYRNRDGKLVIADGAGRRNTLPGSSHVSLPAWSADGTKLAFLQKTGRKKYDLLVAGVSR